MRLSIIRFLIILVICLINIICVDHTTNAQTIGWTYMDAHPQAVLQGKRNNARSLWTLYSWRGRLYSGHGSDTVPDPLFEPTVRYDPVEIVPFDPQVGRFVANNPPSTTGTFWSTIFREIPSGEARPRPGLNRLATPAGDPTGATQNFVVTKFDGNGSVWDTRTNVFLYHAYDMATLNGSDVWLVGTSETPATESNPVRSDATVWRSTDRGVTFVKSLVVPPMVAGYEISRFYFLGVFNNKLYVQARDVGDFGEPALKQTVSWVFDGINWSMGPDLLPSSANADDYGYQPVAFNNRMVYMTRYSVSTARKDLMVFDGSTVTPLAIPEGATNFTVNGSYLYVLASDGAVRRTNDLNRPYAQWESTHCFPILDADTGLPAGRSIAVLNGAIYIGTSDATLYKLDSFVLSSDPCTISAPPPPPPGTDSSSDSL